MTDKFEYIEPPNTPVSDEELITDLKRIAEILGRNTVPQKTYGDLATYDYTTVSRRFGSWNKALLAAGLWLSNENNISDERLYENILNLWQHFGRQPRRSDLTHELSEFSQSPYNRSFKTWTNALNNFIHYANSEEIDAPDTNFKISPNDSKAKSGRDPSLRLRYRVLVRDYFACKQCGASPAKDPSIELHLDHVVPWSKGGETTLENLQTLCSACNFGKSNL